MSEEKGTKKKCRRRKILFNRDPHCYWCGIEVLWIEQSGGRLPPDAATLDHLYSRIMGRQENNDNKERTVLACYKCNWERGRQELLNLPPEKRHKPWKERELKETWREESIEHWKFSHDNCVRLKRQKGIYINYLRARLKEIDKAKSLNEIKIITELALNKSLEDILDEHNGIS